MTLLNVYTTLPNFPRFGSVDIPFTSSDPYSPGVLNPDVDLSTFDYEIVEGINVARYPMQLFRPPAIDLWLDTGGALNSTTIPEEVYGNFHVYKALPYPSKPLLHGGEWLPESSFIESNFDAATWALLYSQREVPQSGEWLIDWDVYQHYRDNNYFEEPTVDEGQGVQAFKVSVRYPANYGIGNNPLITVNYSNPGSLYPYQDYLDFFDGNWDWEWKYIDFCEVIPRTPFPNFTPTAQGLGYYEMRTFPTVVRVKAINYINLLSGYPGDSRTILDEPIVTPTNTETCEIGYYRENKLESIPGLRSIDWMRYTVSLIANTPIKLPIKDCTLGTLNVSSASLKNSIIGTQVAPNHYPTKYYFEDYLEELFLTWNDTPTIPTPTSTFRVLGANNDIWNNRNNPTQDIGFIADHPMFTIDTQRACDWHIAPQSNNNGIGTLIMDSPRTIEIHAALDAGKYSRNSIDPDSPRITNIGWFAENIARVLGLRRDDNGKIDRKAEREKYKPQTLNNPTLGEPSTDGTYNGYSLACFGDRGRIMPHLPTAYTAKGKGQELYDVYHDIPQQLEMLLRQLDVSLSIQHGSQIRVNGVDGKIHSYPNQLAVHLECLHRLEKIAYNTEKNLLLSTVTGTELRGLYSGIGIPVTNNFLELKNPNGNKQTLYLPYFTHQKNKPSIAQSLTTVHVNLGVINGVLMPKKQPVKNDIYNPFKKFIPAKD